MTRSRIWKVFVTPLWVSLAAGLSRAYATGMGQLIREVTVTVAPAQEHAFRHGATRTMYAYDAESGPEVYAFQIPYATWAAIGKQRPAGKACRATFNSAVVRHISHLATALFQRNAKTTYDPQNSPPSTLLWLVVSYRLQPGITTSSLQSYAPPPPRPPSHIGRAVPSAMTCSAANRTARNSGSLFPRIHGRPSGRPCTPPHAR